MSEYLYVCHFSNGHIKVGRSVHPKSRIASHADRVSCIGIELLEHHIVKCVGHSVPAETELINRCSDLSTKRNKSEWFEGLEYKQTCNIADEIALIPFNSYKRQTPLKTYLERLPRGGISEFAAKAGISSVYLSQLSAEQDGRVPSPELCVVIWEKSDGLVTRQELRPNDWHLIWPELKEKATACA